MDILRRPHKKKMSPYQTIHRHNSGAKYTFDTSKLTEKNGLINGNSIGDNRETMFHMGKLSLYFTIYGNGKMVRNPY